MTWSKAADWKMAERARLEEEEGGGGEVATSGGGVQGRW